ncbi:hypothetical protein HBH61_104420 [Parastagonospora nodorum]|nr:hypothetical protein HBH61_104420 [Parastagonospora nodorum]
MATSLEDLPAELLLLICGYAPMSRKQEYYEILRLTSKNVNSKLLRQYGRTWFTELPSPESSDISTDSWYGFNGSDKCEKFTFRQPDLDFLLGGGYGDILGSAMSTVPDLKRVAIKEPVPRNGLSPES